MTAKMQSHSSTTKELIGETFVEVFEIKSTGKLPSGCIVIGRMLELCKQRTLNQNKSVSREDASKIVAKELRLEWIKKNVYPKAEKTIANKICSDYKRFIELRKNERCKSKKKSADWYKKAKEFVDKLTKFAYDIRTTDSAYQKQLEEEFKVKMTREDEDFYYDNCFGKYVATCTATVPRDWERNKKRKETRELAYEKKRAATESQQMEQKRINSEEVSEVLANPIDCQNDPSFEKPQISTQTINTDCNLRSSKEISEFPKVRIRTGHRSMNETVMRCVTQCLAETRMSSMEVSKVIVNVANMIFGQDWTLTNEKDNADDEVEIDEEQDEMEEHTSDLSFVFPSRRSIMRCLQDASYLNLEYIAQQILSKEDKVITIGLDDTTKAAGHRAYDLKTDHITIKGPSSKRITLTTGYVENVSHSGADGAKAYEFKLNCLAVLANSTVDELKSQIDFWMTDRAGECETLLQNLGVDKGQMLKCSAHIILGIDHAIDKVYRNVEQKIGVHQLLEVTGGEKIFLSPSTSIHTLGLIAIAKLLSPSHAQHSVSLYTDFKSWMKNNELECHGFKGFVANRFGRIAELAKIYLVWRKWIQEFFSAVVDINSNKLVLAVSTFIENDWLTCCSEIYAEIGDLLIFPLMKLLGIDKMGDKRNKERSWSGVEKFLNSKLAELYQLMKDLNGPHRTGKENFKALVIEEIIDAVKKQMSDTDYFTRSNDEVCEKIKYAPLTNSGCESEFAKFKHQIKANGGSTSIQTLSRKNIISSVKLLADPKFMSKSLDERKSCWDWARTAEEVKEVKKLEKEFLAKVSLSKKLALYKKEQLKKKKTSKTLAVLEKCKQHGGPMTPNSLDVLPKLSEKQLIAEISYLRMTVAPDIRQKRRVKALNGKFKMEQFTITELQTSIRNALRPEANVTSDIETLLINYMRN